MTHTRNRPEQLKSLGASRDVLRRLRPQEQGIGEKERESRLRGSRASADGKCAYDATPLKRIFRVMSTEVQSFQKSLRKVILSEPTGSVRDEQIHAMAIAIHNQKTNKMDYTFKNDNCHLEWEHYDAFKVL